MPFLSVSPRLVSCLLVALFSCTPGGQPEEATRQQIDQLYRQALGHIKNRQPRAALAAFEQLLQLDPAHYEAWLGLGEVFMRLGRFPEALPHLEKARNLNPERIEARFQLARCLLKLQRKKEARELLQSLVAKFPREIHPRLILADLLMTQAPPDPQGALDQYAAIVQFAPDHFQARSGAAVSRLNLGYFKRAARELEQLLVEKPGDPHLSFLLGTALHWRKDFSGAVEAYKKAIDSLPPASPQRPVRQWNLRLVYLQAYGEYPGDLLPSYQIPIQSRAEASPVQFTDVGSALGVAKMDRGRGSAWGDFDGDGDLDLFSVGIQAPHALYRNEGGAAFAEITAAAGLYDERGGWGALCADYDNDGDLDLYVTRDAWEGPAPNSLYQNEGSGQFVDIGIESGVAGAAASFTATWGDYDNDGYLDLYVADGITGDGSPNKLYQNMKNGRFADRAAEAGVAHRGKSLGTTFGDYDLDGDLDLYVADVDGPNSLYRNEANGRFTDITKTAGVARPVQGGYVAFFFDYNNDERPDLLVSAMAYYEDFVQSQIRGRATGQHRLHLYHNNGDGTFTDVAPEVGVDRFFGSMGAGFGDVDYDGLVDVYLSNGGPVMPRFEPNILYHNLGDRFADITESAGVGNLGKGHGATFADFDSDGDLDLYAGIGGHYPGDLWANSLYRNAGHANHWLVVRVAGRTSNHSAIGTRVRLRTGDRVQQAELSSGFGFGSSNSLALEFGLGASTRIDELEIFWPAGKTEKLRNLDVDQVLHFIEPD